MSNIDKKYKQLLSEIYNKGFEYEDPNRKGVKRKQILSYRFEHDFKDGFPIIGLKQSYPKMAFNEMKAFMLGKTNLKALEDLGVTFWRKDAYNYYIRLCKEEGLERNLSPELFESYIKNARNLGDLAEDSFKNSDTYSNHPLVPMKYILGDLGRIYSHQMRNWNGSIDQLNSVLERLKNNIHSTKNVVTMWNPSDMDDCALSPCHRDFEFLTDGENLTVQWTQSSVDTFLGLPMNIMYYSFVCYVFAHYLGLKPKGVIGNLSNVHLYDNSFSSVEEVLSRDVVDNKVEVSVNLPSEWGSLDDYLNQLEYGKSIKILNYKHLGRLDVPMLPYN